MAEKYLELNRVVTFSLCDMHNIFLNKEPSDKECEDFRRAEKIVLFCLDLIEFGSVKWDWNVLMEHGSLCRNDFRLFPELSKICTYDEYVKKRWRKK